MLFIGFIFADLKAGKIVDNIDIDIDVIKIVIISFKLIFEGKEDK